MKIQVLGSGCANCKKLFELTQEAVKQLNLDVSVEYIKDVAKIIEMGVMTSPVLAIDGKPVMTGFVPDIEKIKSLITKNNISQVNKAGNSTKCECGGNC